MTEDVRTVPNDASDVIEFLMNQHQQVRGLLDDVVSTSGRSGSATSTRSGRCSPGTRPQRR